MRIPGSFLGQALLGRQSWRLLVPLVTLLSARAFCHGALHERIAEINARIAEHPEQASLHFELADVYCQHGEWLNALAEVERTENLAPQKYPTGVLRGQSLLETEQFSEACAALDVFLLSNPGHARALVLRARTLVKLNRTDAALTDYRLALVNSAAPQAELVKEVADALSAYGQTAEAIVVLNQAITRLGPVPTLVTRAMDLEAAAGRFDAALRRVDLLEKTAPRPEPWMAKRATLLTRAGRNVEALAAWESLQMHLTSLPNLEQGSYLMRRIADEAQQALKSLASQNSPAKPTGETHR